MTTLSSGKAGLGQNVDYILDHEGLLTPYLKNTHQQPWLNNHRLFPGEPVVKRRQNERRAELTFERSCLQICQSSDSLLLSREGVREGQ